MTKVDALMEAAQAAYEAELSCYDRIKDSVAFALNSIKLETISDCQLRGYGSPLDRTLEQSDMKRQTLDAMLGAMEEYMPKFRQYLRAKGKALGHENGLPWYDLFAPMGKSAAQYTAEDAKRILVELFSTFDSELADMVARAFDEEWIDFYPRDGKSGGAFCAGVAMGLTYGKTMREAVEIGTRLAASVITVSENVCPRFLPRELGLDIDVTD